VKNSKIVANKSWLESAIFVDLGAFLSKN